MFVHYDIPPPSGAMFVQQTQEANNPNEWPTIRAKDNIMHESNILARISLIKFNYYTVFRNF